MSKNNKSVKVNFIMNAILNLSAVIFPLITFPYVSRILTPTGTGRVSSAVALVTYFAMVAQLGIPTYGIRACAIVRDDKEKLSRTAQEIFIINMIMSVIVYGVFFGALFFIPEMAEDKTLYLICSTTIVFNLIGMEWLYKALEEYSYITKRSLFFKFIALVLTFACIHTKDDYLFYGVTTIFAASASNVMNFINVRKYITLKPLRNYDFKHHMKPILIFFGMSVATTIYTNLDTVMLKFMQGNEDAGYYTAAVKVKTVLVGVVTSIGTVLLPRVSYYIEQKRHDEFRKVTAKAMELVVMMALPLVVYFIIYAREAILVLSGADYIPAIIPMQLIMPTVFLIGFTNITGIQILIPQGRENVVLISEIVGAVVDFAINLVLIPSMGSSGAAIGTLVAELAVLIVQAIAMWKFLMEIMRKIKAGKIVLACVLGTVVALLVHLLPITNSFMILVITALLFFGIYGGGLLLMKEPLVYEVVGQMKEKFLKK